MDMGLKLKNRKVWFTSYIVSFICRFDCYKFIKVAFLMLSILHVLWLPMHPLSWHSCLISVHASGTARKIVILIIVLIR